MKSSLKILSAPFFLFIFSAYVNGQTDFTGKWEFDKQRSIPVPSESEYPAIVIRQITQDPLTLKYREIYSTPGQADWSSADESFSLDGKEVTETTSRSVFKRSAKWSPDKKAITLDVRTTYDGKEFLYRETLSLSGDRKTLTNDIYTKNDIEGEKKIKKVYQRK